jgi:hypothetical protein
MARHLGNPQGEGGVPGPADTSWLPGVTAGVRGHVDAAERDLMALSHDIHAEPEPRFAEHAAPATGTTGELTEVAVAHQPVLTNPVLADLAERAFARPALVDEARAAFEAARS